jgi:imidazolonepropionase-like amidohydrolase
LKFSERIVSVCWLGLCLAASAPAFSSNADAIYFGGLIVTVDDKNPSAEAVAVKAGKIVAVGSRAAVETAQKGPKTQMVDLGGKTMIPGHRCARAHAGRRSAGGGRQSHALMESTNR